MIGCKNCKKVVQHQPPVKVCPHCGAPMVYEPVGAWMSIGKFVNDMVRVFFILMAIMIVGFIVLMVV